jgi:putative transposase
MVTQAQAPGRRVPSTRKARPEKAMRENGAPEKIAMDKSGANKAAIDEINGGMAEPITVRQVKYLNNIVEQDHRAVKRVTSSMLGFKSFRAAAMCSLALISCT